MTTTLHSIPSLLTTSVSALQDFVSALRMFTPLKFSLLRKVMQVMSLPTIQNLTTTSLGGYHLILGISLSHF
ncbi:hypothetical protein EDB84DRAFT_1540654 [Lactarius hengduanensis]|nr:hypothetical protein EDB84DRAFT_1540654 [Lactarius hengduanensis]